MDVIIIEQVGIVRKGLHEDTDLVDWAIISYLREYYFCEEKAIIIKNRGESRKFVYLDGDLLLESMPLLKIKTKEDLGKRIEKLERLKLLETYQTKDGGIYFCLTPLCASISFENDEEVGL